MEIFATVFATVLISAVLGAVLGALICRGDQQDGALTGAAVGVMLATIALADAGTLALLRGAARSQAFSDMGALAFCSVMCACHIALCIALLRLADDVGAHRWRWWRACALLLPVGAGVVAGLPAALALGVSVPALLARRAS